MKQLSLLLIFVSSMAFGQNQKQQANEYYYYEESET